jgi:hypothetical protein
MSDKCENNLETTPSEDIKELSMGDLQQLQDLVEQETQEEMLPVIGMEFEDFHQEEFARGIKDASWIAGFYTTCKNAGMYGSDIVNILINRETIEHNLRSSEINSKMNIEMSKNQAINLEKNQL